MKTKVFGTYISTRITPEQLQGRMRASDISRGFLPFPDLRRQPEMTQAQLERECLYNRSRTHGAFVENTADEVLTEKLQETATAHAIRSGISQPSFFYGLEHTVCKSY